jgi:hypothetical protein
MSCTHLRAQLYVRMCRAVPQFTPPLHPPLHRHPRPHPHLHALAPITSLLCTKERERQKTPFPTSHPIQTSRELHHTWYHPIPHPAVLDQARSISPLALGSRPLALRRRVTCRSSHSLLLRPTLLHKARNSRASYVPVCSALLCAALLCAALL